MIDPFNLNFVLNIVAKMKTVSDQDLRMLKYGAVPPSMAPVVYVGEGKLFLSRELKCLRILYEREYEKYLSLKNALSEITETLPSNRVGEVVFKQGVLCDCYLDFFWVAFKWHYLKHLCEYKYAGYDSDFRVWVAGKKSADDYSSNLVAGSQFIAL